jgi:glycosyltransferase involved in cell wall biosynthesis
MNVSSNRIRILWFVNSVFPEVARTLNLPPSGGGWWLVALADGLRKRGDVELAIVTVSVASKVDHYFRENGIDFFVVAQSPFRKMLNRLGLVSPSSVVQPAIQIVKKWKPDVVVVHGTENGYGLISSEVSVPVLVELQGILNGYLPFFWGSLIGSWSRILYPRSIRNWYSMKRRARDERLVFSKNQYFSGRTFWDQSQLFQHNPTAVYFEERRVLRPEFIEASWCIKNVKKNSIYTTTTPHFLKGTDCLVKALSLLRRVIPDVELSIGGLDGSGEVGRYLRRQIESLGLVDSVRFLGYLPTSEIVKQLLSANAYVIPSYIENSPNNMVEAMAVGTPTIASAAGGIPSMLNHNVDGLLFNCGDSAMLALTLKNIFEDNDLAKRLSKSARIQTLNRHKSEEIVDTHLASCRAITNGHWSK